MYLGCSLLLSRLSAEAANIRHDTNLLWTNKYDRCAAGGLHPHLQFGFAPRSITASNCMQP